MLGVKYEGLRDRLDQVGCLSDLGGGIKPTVCVGSVGEQEEETVHRDLRMYAQLELTELEDSDVLAGAHLCSAINGSAFCLT